MARGGKRAGAGRKKGSLSQKTRVIAECAASEGITPLEVMLKTMRSAWAKASRNGETVTSFKDALIAAAMAEKAAPYVHPRLAAQKHEVSGNNELPTPQVVIFIPDNGRDPHLVTPVLDPQVEANGPVPDS
jgi:predicted nuclease with RNAse H fold